MCGLCARAEYIFVVLLELLSSVFTAVLVGEVMSIVAHRRHINKAREERMDGIQALLFECDVPRDIRQQLRKWAVRAAWSRFRGLGRTSRL